MDAGTASTGLYSIWDDFLRRWPLESLQQLTLQSYTAAGEQDTFTYWLEARTEKLGSIWGGSAFKFGIYSRKSTAEQAEASPQYIYTTDYAWRRNAGEDPDSAFERIKSSIVRIADSARAGRLEEVHDDVLWPIVAWKIAFMYQDRNDPKIVPVFRHRALRAFLGDAENNVSIPELQRRVMAQRGQQDLFDYAKEVWNTAQDRLGTTPLTQDAAFEFLSERFVLARPAVQYMAGFKTASGRPLALDRQTQTVGIFLEPCELNIDGLEVTKRYGPNEPRHSNLAAHAPELAQGHPAIRVKVSTVKALSVLADAYDSAHGGAGGHVNRQQPPSQPLNQILYGPPGTGKTYATVDKALAILDPEFFDVHADDRAARKGRFDEFQRAGLVQFVTFHQSFSYEDFVEGIRAETDADSGHLRYFVADGVFKALCDAARSKTSVIADPPLDLASRRIWKMSLGAADTETHIFDECIKRGIALLGWGSSIDFSGCSDANQVLERFHSSGREDAKPTDYDVRAVNLFKNSVRVGDLIVVSDGNEKFRAIGEVAGEYRFEPRTVDEYAQARDIRWLRTFSPSLPFKELLEKRFSQMTLYELGENTISRDRLRNLLSTDQSVGSAGVQPFTIGDKIGNGYEISEVTSETLWLRKPNGSALPLNRRILDDLAKLVAEQKITISDIRERKVFEKLPDLKIEKFLVNGYDTVNAAVVERIVAANRRVAPAAHRSPPAPRVLIIDEINRGNVSRIFGELITLIEPSKRLGSSESLEVVLPYSKDPFGVPANVYLIGTMNTADRSLASVDIALRRRFEFIEMRPDIERLSDVVVEGVSISAMLEAMNARIEVLLDRDHQIGHAYFMDLIETPELSILARIFRRQLVPLLQEYFFEDWSKIRLVLNEHRKDAHACFIIASKHSASALFGEDPDIPTNGNAWVVNESAFGNIESYKGIVGTPS